MNEKFFSLPKERQQAILNAGYHVFSQNTYKNLLSSKSPDVLESASLYCFIIFGTNENCIYFYGKTVFKLQPNI